MATLSAEALFERYLWPLYPPEAKSDLGRARTEDANPASNPTVLAHLDDAAQVFERMAAGLFGNADPRLDRTDASVHRLSVLLTPERRDEWAGRGEPGTADNELFNVAIHAALYVGACVVDEHSGRWRVRRPLWESVVSLESRAGIADLALLQWVVKSLADPVEGFPPTTLADRYRTHVEIPCLAPDALPIFLRDAARRIPRLAKVRYASLHQHLRAHVPEIKDLGEHFPSAERFEAMRFEWLDFIIVGEGRLLLLFGPGQGGAHLLWLNAHGFEKSAYFMADAFPAPLLKADPGGEKLRLFLSIEEKQAVQEMLWWGP